MVRDNIDSLDDVGMFQGGSNTELCSDLLLVLAFRLARPFGSEFLDGEYAAAVLCTGLNQADGPTCTAAKNAAPFTILL